MVVVLGWSVFLSALSAVACAGVVVPGWAVSFFLVCLVCVLGAGWSACSRALVAQGGNLFGVDRKLLFKTWWSIVSFLSCACEVRESKGKG